jgi:hypothetical protein
VRDDRVEQDAGHVVDVERVADPGERVVEIRISVSAATLVPSARIGWTVTTASAGWPSRVSIVSMAVPSRSERMASSSPATATAASDGLACEPVCGWLPLPCAPSVVSSMSCAPRRSSGLRDRIWAAFLSCCTTRPSLSIPRISVRTDEDSAG